MSVFHVVMMGFKPLATAEEVQDVCDRMLALKDQCLHPETRKPYVKMSIGGADADSEDKDGMTHAFISEFENGQDRAYFLERDPAYAEFRASIDGIVNKSQMVGFRPGVF